MAERVWTPTVRTGTPVTVKRACNGCGLLLGDVTDAELDRAAAGLPLAGVRTECPCCRPELVAGLVETAGRLRGELADERAVHAKTVDNFEAARDERAELARLRREVEGLRAWRDGNHDEHRQLLAEVKQWRATYGDAATVAIGMAVTGG